MTYSGGNAGKFKSVNTFHHCLCGNENALTYNANSEIEFYVQVGSTRMPIYPIRNAGEAFNHLQKALGIRGSFHHNVDINPYEYYTSKFVLAMDFEKKNQRRREKF